MLNAKQLKRMKNGEHMINIAAWRLYKTSGGASTWRLTLYCCPRVFCEFTHSSVLRAKEIEAVRADLRGIPTVKVRHL